MKFRFAKSWLPAVLGGFLMFSPSAKGADVRGFCSFLLHRAGITLGFTRRPPLPTTYSLVQITGVPDGVTLSCSRAKNIRANIFRIDNLQSDRFYEVVLAYRGEEGLLQSAQLQFQGGEMIEIQFDHLVSIATP